MHLVLVSSDGAPRRIEAAEGLSVMEVLRREGLIEGECNGSLACATCHVWVDAAWIDAIEPPASGEEDMLDVAFNIGPTSRLSCQILLSARTDGIMVSLPRSAA